jgi:methylglutaconyl-CoA hydratase
MADALSLDVADGIARISLNRPQVHNAFDDALIAELSAALDDVATDRRARVLVLGSSGKSFCAGADLNWMKRMAGYDHDQNLADAEALARMLHRLYTLPKPSLAAVQGAAYGGGVGLVACCDLALAGPRAAFSLSEVKLGLIPATISPFVVEAIGARAARKLALTGERIDATAAAHLGLVHEVLPDDEALHARAQELAATLATYGPQTLAAIKSLIAAVAGRPIEETLHADTARRIADQRTAPEGREGVAAFLDKRRAQWPG